MPDSYLDALSVDDITVRFADSIGREESSGKRTIVVEDSTGPCGYAVVGTDSDDDSFGLLFLLYVAPDRWNQGVGTQLMQAATDEIRSMGFHSAALWVLEENRRARHFYEKFAYRPDGQSQLSDYCGTALRALRYASDL
jgi:GNAT superfamily N-acetyltransferase